MKLIHHTLIMALALPAAYALQPGDIAFTGFNADGDDNLAFVALVDLPAATVIHFTDEEWNGAGWASNTESAWTWTATSNIAAGSVVTIDNLNGLFAATTTSNLGTIAAITDAFNNAGLAASNEAVFAFESDGTVDANGVPNATGNFLAVIANEDAAGGGFSLTGTGLSEAAGTAIIFTEDEDGMRYIGSRSGETAFADYLLLIGDRATNWETQASDGTLVLPFDLTPFVEGVLSNTLTLSVSPANFSESATNPAATGTVTRSDVTASDLEVTLSSPDTSEVTVPATVTIPANQASVNFDVTAVDDSLPDGNKPVTLTATAPASSLATFEVTVEDDADTLPPTALSAGDIAFTCFNADGTDGFAFVALKNIPASEVIHFTDAEWDGSIVDGADHFTSGEGNLAWTAPIGGVTAGTVVVITDLDTTSTAASVGSVVGGDTGLSSSSETIYAYQGFGTRQPITFLAAIANHTGDSIANTGLTSGSTAIYLTTSTDYAEYTGARTGQAAIANYLPLIGDTANNWVINVDGDGSAYVCSATPFTTGPAGALVSIGAATSTTEGDAGTATLTYTVSRSDNTTEFSIDYAVTGGTASSGVDYVAIASGTLNFTIGGGISQTVSIDVNGDTEIESNETVIITLSNLVQTTGVTNVGNSTGTGTITNDDTVPVTFPPNNKSTFAVKGSIGERSPGVGLSGAEIPAFDPASKRAFLSSASGIEVIDMTDPAAPVYLGNISLVALGLPSDDISSVTVRDGVLAASAISSPKTAPGRVAFIDAATAFPVPLAALLGSATVGAVPDHLTFTPDGTKVLTADEGELVADPSGDTTPGTVSIIDVSGGFVSPPVSTAGFASFNASAAALKAAGVRIFDGGTPEFDFEPEYLAVSADSSKAMVSLQEANAVAILDIATATFTSVVPLGEKDFSTLRADFSDRDGAGGSNLVNPTTGNPVFGLYMPDQIASFQSGGQTYYITANEGDDRDDFLTGGEGARLADLNLDDTVFPNEPTLHLNGELGRLNVSNTTGLDGDIEPDGDIDRILAFGGRSFSILDSTGAIVYDSGDMIEMIVASQFPANFPDGRSDNKGPEPEGVTTAVIGCCTYAFVGLERSNMVLVFDITNPLSPEFVTGLENAGDTKPEGMTVVSGPDSPSGKPLLLVANEDSNTLTVYELTDSTHFALQILHASDLEGGVDAIENAPAFAAVVDALEADADKRSIGSILLSAGDNYIPGPFFNAAANSSFNPLFNSAYNTLFGTTEYNGLRAEAGRVDITIMNILGFDASAVGNHEFDDTSAGMELVIEEDFRSPNGPASDRWVGAQFPYLSANLDFTGDSALGNLHTSSILPNTAFRTGPAESLANNTTVPKLAPATTINVDGEIIGVVGATTQLLSTISSPSGTVGTAGNVNDMPALAAVLQPVIDDLKNGDDNIPGNTDDVNKIVLVSHLQQLALEQALAPLLSGVDVIIAGGSDTLLADSTDHLRSGDTAAGTYPVLATNLDSDPVAIVSTDGEYSYVGRLVVCFDENGVLLPASIDEYVSGTFATDETGVLDTTGEATLAAAIAASPKAVEVEKLTDNVTSVIVAKDGDVKGFTDVYIEGRRNLVRTEETTLGNLTADANLVKAQTVDADVCVSIKNGGGVRASIGAIDGLTGDLLPPQPNPAAGKPLGAVSQLDIENTLRFNNQLTILTLTADGLKQVIEHGVSAWTTTATPGQFPQIGGMKFSFDPALPAGSRVRSMVILNADGSVKDCIVAGGNLVGDSTRQIKIVTLNFLANPSSGNPAVGGDSYPFPSLAVGGPAAYVNTGIGEQAAFADLLTAEYPDAPNAFDVAETPASLDLRIQNLAFRSDDVDTVAPVISCAKQIVVTVAPGESASVNYSPTAFDACDGVLPVSVSLPSGSTFPVGSTTVTATATDSAGNVGMASFEVIVLEEQPVGSPRYLDAVVVRGDAAAGAGVDPGIAAGSTILSINNAFLNDAGTVAFDATLLGNGTNNAAVFRRPDGGPAAPVAVKGTSFGAGNYGVFSYISLNNGGDIGFQSLTTAGGTNAGQFANDGTATSVAAVRLGVAPGTGGATYRVIYQPALASNGDLLTPAVLNFSGTVTFANDGLVSSAGTVLAREGEATGIPSANYGHHLSRIVTSNGNARYALATFIAETPPNYANNLVILSGTLGGGQAIAVRKGDAAAGTPGTFGAFLGESVNGDGEIALRAYVGGAGVTAADNEGIWTNSGNTGAPPVLVAREGDVAPCIANGQATFGSFRTVYMGDDGSVCFLAYLKDTMTGMVNPGNDASIWLWRNGVLDLLVREGDLANNTAGSAIARIANFDSNGDGGIVYSVDYVPGMGDATTLNNQAVYVDRGAEDLAPLLVLRRGDKFDHDGDAETAHALIANLRISTVFTGGGSTGGYGRAINAAGEVLLNIGFTGSAGLFVIGSEPVVTASAE